MRKGPVIVLSDEAKRRIILIEGGVVDMPLLRSKTSLEDVGDTDELEVKSRPFSEGVSAVYIVGYVVCLNIDRVVGNDMVN